MTKPAIHPKINIFIPAASKASIPVTVGVPFPRGMLREANALSLVSPGGNIEPASGRALAKWPDGSVRWALLTILAKESGSYRYRPGVASPDRSGSTVRLESSPGKILLGNGLVEVTLAESGEGPIESLTALGHKYLARAGDFRLRVDSADTRRESHRSLKVLEQSPERVRVRIEGAHFEADGARRLSYRLDVELWAGWPALRLDYQFFNLEPGHEQLEIGDMAMEFDFALGPQTRHRFLQSYHGAYYQPREVFNPDPVAIVADDAFVPPHVEDPAMLRDDTVYPSHLRPPLDRTAPWLGVGDNGRSVFACMQDFAAMRPKRLLSDGSHLALEVWPKRAGVLTLPQGRSRRQVLTLAFDDQPKPPLEWITGMLDAPLSEGRACVDPQWLAHCGEFGQDRALEFGRNSRFEKYLRRLMLVNTPLTMFDLGDTVDSGYLLSYTAVGLQRPLPGTPEVPRVFMGPHLAIAPQSQPGFYEPVWANNEYDLIHAFCSEIMRTGSPDHWTLARWAVRHNIEVDFLHYHDDRWQHRATPAHSANHTTTGAYPSHFWTQGLLEYYCLSGDPDALEAATALGDKIIENFSDPERRSTLWGFNRELGWPVLALSQLGDITGEPRFRDQLDSIMDFLVGFNYWKHDRPVNLSSVNPRQNFMRQVVSAFFGYASMFEGVDHYARWSGRNDINPWLSRFLDDFYDGLLQTHLEGEPTRLLHMHTVALAIGFERSGDERFLRLGMVCLREFMDSNDWIKPLIEAKPVAMTHRALARFLFHAERQGLLEKLEYPELLDDGLSRRESSPNS